MKKVIYKAFVVTLLGLAVSTPTIKANDVYVPFGEKKFTEIENSQKIDFDDLNLKEALLEYYKFHINKDYKGEEVTIGMMEQFTSLSLPWKNIFSLKGLEYAVNLKNLNLSNNFIEDITPLEKLVELEDLNLTNNKIKDPKSLAKLTKLRQLVLRKNLMNNLDFLNDLKVESLDVSMNSVLKDYIPNNLKLENLRSLNISGIGLDNISFIKNATKLESLVAEENAIKDITPLTELKSLRVLYLDRNSISDISALKNISSLEELLLYKNNIENIDVLKDVPNISSVDISDTAVSDISALKDAKYLYYIALKNTKVSETDITTFEKNNLEVKKSNNIDKKLEVVKTEAAKYFSVKNYIFMLLILIFTFSGIRSYWKKNK